MRSKTSPESLPFAIALTGGIATGKSTVASLLKLYGFEVIDADTIAHECLEARASEVVELLGESILQEGKIDRKRLGAMVFSDKAALQKLESLLHPMIRSEILHQAKRLEERGFPYFIDIPLFFEKQESYAFIPRSIVVYAPPSLQESRLKKRDSLSSEAIRNRLNAQMSIEEKVKCADYILRNEGDLEALTHEVERLTQLIKKELHV